MCLFCGPACTIPTGAGPKQTAPFTLYLPSFPSLRGACQEKVIRADTRVFRRSKGAQRPRRKSLGAGRTPPGADLDSRSAGSTIPRLVKGASALVAAAGRGARDSGHHRPAGQHRDSYGSYREPDPPTEAPKNLFQSFVTSPLPPSGTGYRIFGWRPGAGPGGSTPVGALPGPATWRTAAGRRRGFRRPREVGRPRIGRPARGCRP